MHVATDKLILKIQFLGETGPGCIKKLKIRWEFLQLFPVFLKVFSHRHYVSYTLFIYPPSADLSIIACKKIFRNTGNGCRNSHLTLSCFMQPGPYNKR